MEAHEEQNYDYIPNECNSRAKGKALTIFGFHWTYPDCLIGPVGSEAVSGLPP
jgi:hypothetical protein